jgi:hypothetical protein
MAMAELLQMRFRDTHGPYKENRNSDKI